MTFVQLIRHFIDNCKKCDHRHNLLKLLKNQNIIVHIAIGSNGMKCAIIRRKNL
ncbi:hypothetical protein D1BOALGB6SA_8379 [Olavius sp. associated proteobacterium Delta 1]|nr:hypothetical protein D1BOALGB6SA_8379 [Olavius sp. associated proteobacterium Delta 1]